MIQQMQKMFLIEFLLNDKNQDSKNRYFIKGGNVNEHVCLLHLYIQS